MVFVDLSRNNDVKDWSKVKKTIDGVILRVAYRGYGSGKITADTKFSEYASACHDMIIPFGIYFMSQAITEEEAEEEAKYSVSMAEKYGATLPIIIDSEDGDGTAKVVRADGLSKAKRTAIAVKFCETVKNLGYVSGVYASKSWFISNLDVNQLLAYKLWVAQYNSVCTASHRVDMWQYTSKGTCSGINGNVDLSYVYGIDVKKDTETELAVDKNMTITKGNTTDFANIVKNLKLALNEDYDLSFPITSTVDNVLMINLGNIVLSTATRKTKPNVVTALQQLLVWWGFSLSVDGDFYNATKSVIANFQSLLKLSQTGTTTLEFWKKLLGYNA